MHVEHCKKTSCSTNHIFNLVQIVVITHPGVPQLRLCSAEQPASSYM